MDPWGELGRQRHLTVIFAEMPDSGRYYESHQVIVLAKGMTQAKRRSTLAHELVHAENRDRPCCSSWHEQKQERIVDDLAARRLIPLDALIDALLWSQDDQELADCLWVDVATVRARRRGLTEREFRTIDERLWAAEGRMP